MAPSATSHRLSLRRSIITSTKPLTRPDSKPPSLQKTQGDSLEVAALIVLTFGANAAADGTGRIQLAASRAVVAVVLVTLAGAVVHRPLSQVPENTMQFAVGHDAHEHQPGQSTVARSSRSDPDRAHRFATCPHQPHGARLEFSLTYPERLPKRVRPNPYREGCSSSSRGKRPAPYAAHSFYIASNTASSISLKVAFGCAFRLARPATTSTDVECAVSKQRRRNPPACLLLSHRRGCFYPWLSASGGLHA